MPIVICTFHSRSKLIDFIIETINHSWQVAERSIVKPKSLADMTLHEYLGYVQLGENVLWNPDDVYWGQLVGASAAISGGITTILDHSHISLTSAHVESALRATLDSGVRSVFAPQKWNQSAWEDWQAAQFQSLGKRLPGGSNGRVTLGLAYDSINSEPAATVNSTMAVARAAGVNLTTFHYVASYDYGSITGANANYPLDSSFVVSHCTYALQEEFELLQHVGAGMVATPGTDGPMALGNSEAFVRMESGMSRIGLGIDAHSAAPGSMFETMRMGLQSARTTRNAELYAGALGVPERSLPKQLVETIAQAARFATLGGAEAMHMESSIGSIAEGKQADLILVALDSPDVLGISPTDDESLLAGFVMFANPSDVKTVIISGEVVKGQGELKRVQWYGNDGLVASFGRQRDDLIERLRGSTVNWTANYEAVLEQFGLSSRLV
jgi:cytosine/adenosine deaminase-related metal-dependent hydrolase